jgi:hypothetical protein
MNKQRVTAVVQSSENDASEVRQVMVFSLLCWVYLWSAVGVFTTGSLPARF